jgi:hypothetical protein
MRGGGGLRAQQPKQPPHMRRSHAAPAQQQQQQLGGGRGDNLQELVFWLGLVSAVGQMAHSMLRVAQLGGSRRGPNRGAR